MKKKLLISSDGRAGKPALVEQFSIHGLYGYRTICLKSSYAATILIARNGSGKTTLLGALEAFLRGQFGRLGGLHFEKVSCKLRGVAEVLELSKADIDRSLSVPEDSEFLLASRRWDIDPSLLLDYLENDFPAEKEKGYAALHENEVFQKIYAKTGYEPQEAKRQCEKLADGLRGRVPAIDHVRAALRSALGATQIVYLPTYRRIELSLGERPEDGRAPHRRKQSIQSRLGLSKRGLLTAEIQFGLADISERLEALNKELVFSSNQGYSEISAKIVNDLLDGTFEKESVHDSRLPEKDVLTLFFARLEQGSRRFRPHFGDVKIPDIDKIYGEGGSSEESNRFLKYFLGQLKTVIETTRGIEGLVDDFVSHCNAYLADREASTEIATSNAVSRRISSGAKDSKRLVLDRRNLKVRAFSVAANRAVPMDSLSSGEKQMISLFASLYLYPGEKIVLIDEPELSLSIDWQRKIMLDVVNAPTCAQAIAITHSPFVFDNELEPFAKSLSVTFDQMIGPVQLDIEEDSDV